MAAHHITIGPEFFAKARNDYEDWYWALVREFYQNSIDCKSKLIETWVTLTDDGNTQVAITNDGTPMDQEILVEKLLCLGGSGKNFEEGSTGGFGKAKEILYFCHISYIIESGNYRVEGSGATYDLSDNEFRDGTRSIIVIEGDHVQQISEQAEKFAKIAQWSGDFFIDGIRYDSALKKGSPRRDLGFGKVYTNKSTKYRMIVRINGVPMFTQRTGFDRCVIVELKGQSDQILTSNRDGLVNPFRSELSDFVTELSVDKRSALKDSSRGPRYVEYRGTKLCHESEVNVADIVADPLLDLMEEGRAEYPEEISNVETEHGGENGEMDDGGSDSGSDGGDDTAEDAVWEEDGSIAGIDVDSDEEVNPPVLHEQTVHEGGGRAAAFTSEPPEPRRLVATLGTNFIVKNETDLKVPAYYDPGSGEFSTYSKKLTKIWGRIMIEMHRLFDTEATFSIGFIFDESAEAEWEEGDYGTVYYLNPCKIVEQKRTYSKSFAKRFKLTERDRLITIGAHEFVHGLGYGWHDERYANKLTEVLAIVMKHRKRFNWVFK